MTANICKKTAQEKRQRKKLGSGHKVIMTALLNWLAQGRQIQN